MSRETAGRNLGSLTFNPSQKYIEEITAKEIVDFAFEYVGWYCKRNDNDYRYSMGRDEFFNNLVIELQGILNEKGSRHFTWWDAHEVFNRIQCIINDLSESCLICRQRMEVECQ
jgi:hypothetical protein